MIHMSVLWMAAFPLCHLFHLPLTQFLVTVPTVETLAITDFSIILLLLWSFSIFFLHQMLYFRNIFTTFSLFHVWLRSSEDVFCNYLNSCSIWIAHPCAMPISTRWFFVNHFQDYSMHIFCSQDFPVLLINSMTFQTSIYIFCSVICIFW